MGLGDNLQQATLLLFELANLQPNNERKEHIEGVAKSIIDDYNVIVERI